MNDRFDPDRRRLLQAMAGMGLASVCLPVSSSAVQPGILSKAIPSTGEPIPVIGLGTFRTFNVGDDKEAIEECTQVMQHFLNTGGRMIDSSPMYGSSQDVIGIGLKRLGRAEACFSTDKVWTGSKEDGPRQMEASRRKWQVKRFDLLQVHNLLEWEGHLETLRQMKADGRVRYIGITTSHGRRHSDLARILEQETLDFVQLTYNIVDREVEQRLLPIAAERGVAVIANRPFRRGDLIERLQGKPLPDWAQAIDCANWPQFLLKFIVSHPAVTTAIPATSQVAHVLENMGAGRGRLPDGKERQQMIDYVRQL